MERRLTHRVSTKWTKSRKSTRMTRRAMARRTWKKRKQIRSTMEGISNRISSSEMKRRMHPTEAKSERLVGLERSRKRKTLD